MSASRGVSAVNPSAEASEAITVSDTAAAQGAAADASAPLIASLLPSDTFAVRSPATIVPDDKDKIQAALREAIESGAELVLTTGGTGFGKRDVTPEVRAVLSLTRCREAQYCHRQSVRHRSWRR